MADEHGEHEPLPSAPPAHGEGLADATAVTDATNGADAAGAEAQCVAEAPGAGAYPSFVVAAADHHRSRRARVLRAVRIVLLTALAACCLFAVLVPLDRWVSFAPGASPKVRLTISGAKSYPPKGNVLLTTVGVVQRHTLVTAAWAWWDDDVSVFPREQIFPHQDAKQSRAESKREMKDSQSAAVVLALRTLGYAPTSGGIGISVVEPTFPVAKVLQAGDVVTDVDGERVCTTSDVRAALDRHRVGDAVDVAYERDGKARRGRVELRGAPAASGRAKGGASAGRPILGIAVAGTNCKFPVDVRIDTGAIGGPSAGLAMTIAVLDALTPGELTGGRTVAATGTIELDGSVGVIGGIEQKTTSVRSAGATLFLVPAEESAQARTRAKSLAIAPVRTLDDALAALEHAGGDPLPPPSPASRPQTSP